MQGPLHLTETLTELLTETLQLSSNCRPIRGVRPLEALSKRADSTGTSRGERARKAPAHSMTDMMRATPAMTHLVEGSLLLSAGAKTKVGPRSW